MPKHLLLCWTVLLLQSSAALPSDASFAWTGHFRDDNGFSVVEGFLRWRVEANLKSSIGFGDYWLREYAIGCATLQITLHYETHPEQIYDNVPALPPISGDFQVVLGSSDFDLTYSPPTRGSFAKDANSPGQGHGLYAYLALPKALVFHDQNGATLSLRGASSSGVGAFVVDLMDSGGGLKGVGPWPDASDFVLPPGYDQNDVVPPPGVPKIPFPRVFPASCLAQYGETIDDRNTPGPALKGHVRFSDGTPMRKVRVALVDASKKEIASASAVTADDGFYSIPFETLVSTGRYFLKATTQGSNASTVQGTGKQAKVDRRGEAVNWYTDGKVGPHDWSTYNDPFAREDLLVQEGDCGIKVTGGDAYGDYLRGEVDIYFPLPMVWVHGIFTTANRFWNQYNFFSNPDLDKAPVVDRSLSYFVDTLKTGGPGNLECLPNAALMESYMATAYDVGMSNLVENYRTHPPKFNLICHSMGAPISRLWECIYNDTCQRGDVEYYLSISGIHGGNYSASFYTARWPKFCAKLSGGYSAAGCAVRSINALNNAYPKPPHGKLLFAWGINGVFSRELYGPVANLFWQELKPNDGMNNAPSATSQNGPYPEGPTRWFHPDADLDLRKTRFGQYVGQAAKRMAYVDLGDKTLRKEGFGDHSFMDSGSGCMANCAEWLGLGADSTTPRVYTKTDKFADWPRSSQGSLAEHGTAGRLRPAGLAGEETALVDSLAEELVPKTYRYEVPIDACSEAQFSLVWFQDSPLTFRLVDPSGQEIDPAKVQGLTNWTYWATDPTGAEISQRHYVIGNPPVGRWVLVVEAGTEVPVEGLPLMVETTEQTDLLLLHQLEPREVAAGASVHLQAAIARNQSRLQAGTTLEGTIWKPDETTATVSFYDDGLHGDGAPGDGLYGAEYTDTSLTGEYALEIQGQGVNDQGQAFRRRALDTFTVMSAKAALGSVVGQTALDINGDGRYEQLKILVSAHVKEAGQYALSASLVGADGWLLDGATRQARLEAGSNTVELVFEGQRIRDSRRDGPYRIETVRLAELVPTESQGGASLVTSDRLPGYCATQPYRFYEFSGTGGPQPPILTAAQFLPAGVFEYYLLGLPGTNYTIEVSTNGTQWTSLTNVVGTPGPTRVLDSAAKDFDHRFYRAAQVP